MTEAEATARREWLFKGWQALRSACRAQHPRKPGGAAMCICGAGCGGSQACQMLATLRDWIVYLPDDGLPADMRRQLELLRSVV